MKTTFHVVTAADGTIFAVFGENKKAEAEARANVLRNSSGISRASFFVQTVKRTKKPIPGCRL